MAILKEKQSLARPFLKWAGGKGQLLSDIETHLPAELRQGKINTYIEPFLGGGAVFFHIAQRYDSITQLYLLDINKDLISCYQTVKSDVESLIAELSNLQDEFLALDQELRKKFYLQIRESFNKEKSSRFGPTTAAKLIFLNKTCFNGLYRVNRKGLFNVPFGDYKRPTICDADNLRNASKVLQEVDLTCADFENSEAYVNNSAFVYLDPPYRPLSPTAGFTSYSKASFSEEDQVRLANFCRCLDRKDAKFLLSNSDPKNEDPSDRFFDKQYEGFRIDQVKASRAINCDGSGRGQINELLIANY